MVESKGHYRLFDFAKMTASSLQPSSNAGHLWQPIPQATIHHTQEYVACPFIILFDVMSKGLQVSMDNDGILRVQVDYSFCQLQTPPSTGLTNTAQTTCFARSREF